MPPAHSLGGRLFSFNNMSAKGLQKLIGDYNHAVRTNEETFFHKFEGKKDEETILTRYAYYLIQHLANELRITITIKDNIITCH